MEINKTVNVSYTIKLNSDEFEAIKSIIDDLTFDSNNISNQFEAIEQEIKIFNYIKNNIENISYD